MGPKIAFRLGYKAYLGDRLREYNAFVKTSGTSVKVTLFNTSFLR